MDSDEQGASEPQPEASHASGLLVGLSAPDTCGFVNFILDFILVWFC